MAYTFLFPDLGEGLTEGKLLQWYVQEGQTVMEGDLVAKVETDKVVADIPLPKGGRVLKLHGKPEEILLVGNPLVELETGGAAAPAPAPARKDPEPAAAAAEAGPGVVGTIEVATGSDVMAASGEGFGEEAPAAPQGRLAAPQGRLTASPVARKLAKDLGVDLAQVAGSGPQGRVMKADVERAGQPAAAAAVRPQPALRAGGPRGERIEPLSQLRKTVAARMVQAKQAPHATTFEEVEVSALVALRQAQRDRWEDQGVRLSYMPLICKAVATALIRHPKLNCRLEMEQNRAVYPDYVNLGLAVDTPDGLIVPVIRDADRLTVRELALAIDDLAARARNRQIRLDEMKAGTFTITNYGAIAGIHGTPILNAPESAILGVGRLLDKPVVKDGQVVPGKVLPLSLAIDHRIIDGGDAARFLKELMGLLADPVGMLLD